MDRQLFDLLKTPQQLNWLEGALIRDGIQEGHEFEEAYGVSVESAERILFAWEAAQSSEWNRELLCQFIDPEIFPDRRIVQLRVEAAMPERFTPTAGLHWLKEERIPVGDLDEWVRQNTATPAPTVTESASDGVEPAKAGPLPLTTGDIAFCFAGLRWQTETAWKKPLGDKPKWLADCIVIPGVRGVSETRWSPVCIGAALVRAGHAKPNSVRAKFQTQPLLKPWLDEWKTYEADNSNSN